MNLGKWFPTVAAGHIFNRIPPYQGYPPRKTRFKFGTNNLGSVGATWVGLEVNSEVVVPSVRGGIWQMWEFINPTVPTNRIELHAMWGVQTGTIFANDSYNYVYELELYDSVGLMRTLPLFVGTAVQMWTHSGFFSFGPGPFPTPPSTPKWYYGDMASRACLWADDPSYHPYRH